MKCTQGNSIVLCFTVVKVVIVVAVTDPCSFLVCQNDGNCVVNNNGTAECDCPPGFEGSTCEKGTRNSPNSY